MPDIFKSMTTGGDSRAIEEAWHFIYRIYVKKREPVPEHHLIQFLRERVPAHSVARIVEVMERARLLKAELTKHGKGFVPMERTKI
jgi:hypothetical protein